MPHKPTGRPPGRPKGSKNKQPRKSPTQKPKAKIARELTASGKPKRPGRYKPVPPRNRRAAPKVGHPFKYRPEFAERAFNYALLGCTNDELALAFDVNVQSIYLWRAKHADFADALARGALEADGKIARSIYNRARGITRVTTKDVLPDGEKIPITLETEHYYPPETGAGKFWLTNRHPDKWRERREITQAPPQIPEDYPTRIKWAQDLIARAKAILAAPMVIEHEPVEEGPEEDE